MLPIDDMTVRGRLKAAEIIGVDPWCPTTTTPGNAKSEFELAELVGRIGNFYTKKGLSPPFFLRDAAREWHGLSQDEIVVVLEKHFHDYRHLYIAGAGDQHFHLVRSAINKAIEAKYPSRDRSDDELERPLRKASWRGAAYPPRWWDRCLRRSGRWRYRSGRRRGRRVICNRKIFLIDSQQRPT
jgi:hypothetical protein